MFSFYDSKKVLVTGHTGFKGAWLCRMLINAGATVTGYSLAPPTMPSLYELSGLDLDMTSVIGDVRDYEALKKAFISTSPEIVFHLAAQPLVREGYKEPRTTYETNVMGTVNILECIRLSDSVRSFLNITSDKVYKNREAEAGYCEEELLDGYDPYSNSKSCSEIITHGYRNSFFNDGSIAVSTARSGNVIGGGDFAKDRIIPDCVRAAVKGETILVRNPKSIRPYQHVLEALYVYLMIAAKQYENELFAGYYNVGPNEPDCCETEKLVKLFCDQWGEGLKWVSQHIEGPHEAGYLKLNCSKLKRIYHWNPRWDLEKAVEKTVEWSKEWINGENITACMNRQIEEYAHS